MERIHYNKMREGMRPWSDVSEAASFLLGRGGLDNFNPWQRLSDAICEKCVFVEDERNGEVRMISDVYERMHGWSVTLMGIYNMNYESLRIEVSFEDLFKYYHTLMNGRICGVYMSGCE